MNPATPTTGIAPVNPASLSEYVPTPLTDFTVPANQAAFEKALATVRGQLGRDYPIVINGERLQGERAFESRNPARPPRWSDVSRVPRPPGQPGDRGRPSCIRHLEPRAGSGARRIRHRGGPPHARAPS
jgi:hypothetical protein